MRKDFVLYGVISILAFLLLRNCNGDKGGEVEVIIKTDTIRTLIKGKPDTVFFTKQKIIYKDLPPDTIIIIDDSTKVYTTLISDSIIEGSIKSLVRGCALVSTDLSYRPLVPKYITRVDTFKIEIETIKERQRLALSAGVILGGSQTSFSVEPTLMLEMKKSLRFTVGYDLLSKEYKVGVLTKLRNPF